MYLTPRPHHLIGIVAVITVVITVPCQEPLPPTNIVVAMLLQELMLPLMLLPLLLGAAGLM